MHQLFLKKYPQYSKIKYRYYNKIFRTNFRLSFGRPQVDVCGTCEQLNNEIKTATNHIKTKKLKRDLKKHKEESKKFYNKIRKK